MKNIRMISYLLIASLIINISLFSNLLNNNQNLISNKTSCNHTTYNFSQFITNEEELINHKMELTIRNDNTIRVLSTLVIENNETEPLNYFAFAINRTISSVFVYDPIGYLTFSWEIFEESSVLNITMRYPLMENQKYVISISYEITGVIYLVNNYYNLEFIITHWMDTQHFQLIVYLPANYELIEEPSPRPIYPDPDRVFIRDNILIIEWEIDNVNSQFEYFYTIRYKESSLSESTIIYLIPKSVYFYIALSFIGGVFISSLFYFLIIRRKYLPVKQKLVSSLLSDSEQAVLQAIIEEGGTAIQRRICDRTGFSKSKVSQILLKLEEKDILKRERWGRTNRVTITNDSFLNIELEKPDLPEMEKE